MVNTHAREQLYYKESKLHGFKQEQGCVVALLEVVIPPFIALRPILMRLFPIQAFLTRFTFLHSPTALIIVFGLHC